MGLPGLPISGTVGDADGPSIGGRSCLGGSVWASPILGESW